LYVSTIGIIVRQWAISSHSPWPTNPALSEACAWLDARWPVVMTMGGRSRSHGSQATAHQMRAVLSTVLRGECAEKWDTAAASPTYLPKSQGLRLRLLAGNAWESVGGQLVVQEQAESGQAPVATQANV